MNDKEILMDILEMEKNITVNTTYALNEASCDYLYKEIFKMHEQISKTTKEIFNFAYNEGFYPLEKAEQNKITKAIYNLKQELQK